MVITAKIKKVVHDSGPLRAYGKIVFDGKFVVHGVRVIEGPNGPFAAMPSEIGKDHKYRDICHPVSAELRKNVNEAVLAAYKEACGEE